LITKVVRLCLAAALGLACLLLPVDAEAHAVLTVAEPSDGQVLSAPPARAVLRFSEPVAPLAFRLLRPDGEIVRLDDARIEDGAVVVSLPLGAEAGTAILNWRVSSADGHPVGGALTFTIGGEAAGAPARELAWSTYRLPGWAAQVALLISAFAGVGAVVFRYWVFSARARRDMRLASAAGAATLASLAAASWTHALDVTGLTPAEIGFADVRSGLSGAFGASTALIAASSILVLTCALGRPRPPIGRAAAAVAAVALAAAFVVFGHASVATPAWLMRPAIALHIGGALFWLGSLFPLLNAMASSDTEGRVALARYSGPIFVTSVALLLSGAGMAAVQLGAVAELWSSGYGVVLLAKLALVAPMFLLGALNRFALAPRVHAGRGGARRLLRRSIAAEIALGALALGVVGLWRFTPPPWTMEAVTVTVNGLQFHAHGVRAMANLALSPARVGPTRVSVTVLNVDATPLAAQEVSVVLFDPLGQLEPLRRQARKVTSSAWAVDDVTIPVPGRWTVRVDILVSDFEKASVKTAVTIVR
jgi:copper transport protein